MAKAKKKLSSFVIFERILTFYFRITEYNIITMYFDVSYPIVRGNYNNPIMLSH